MELVFEILFSLSVISRVNFPIMQKKSVFMHLSVSVACVCCIPVLALFFLVSL